MPRRGELVPGLLDRTAERSALDDLLGGSTRGARAGARSAGRGGVGKSALLEYAVGAAAGMRVVRALGWSPRWSWRTPACTCSARRCSTG